MYLGNTTNNLAHYLQNCDFYFTEGIASVTSREFQSKAGIQPDAARADGDEEVPNICNPFPIAGYKLNIFNSDRKLEEEIISGKRYAVQEEDIKQELRMFRDRAEAAEVDQSTNIY